MNSDEDPSFPFICEGPSGVLEIFGETTGVLPDMSTSSTVTDLEDVFAKGSIPIQATLKETDPQERTSVEKNSANDVLSVFQDGNTSLIATEDFKKTVQVDNPAVLRTSVEITNEIQKALVDATSTLATGNSVLVSVEGSTKSIQETAPAPVAGSVELAEEIMEAFANSKTVLDAENPVSSDPCNIQEELDRLEQLAVERVREIEGDLVNSSKQITECNLSLDVQKQSGTNEINNSLRKEFMSETVCTSKMAVSCAADIHTKDVGKNQYDNVVADADLTSPSTEAVVGVPEDKSTDVVTVHKKAKPLSVIENSESTKDGVLAQENNTCNEKEVSYCFKSVGSNSEEVEKTANKTELEVKTDTQSELNEKDGNIDPKSTCGGNSAFETDVEEKKKQLVEQNDESKNDDDIQIVEEVVQEKPCMSNKSSSNGKREEIKLDDGHKKSTLETEKTPITVATVEDTHTENKIKDVQDYETEDDDLEVLEAFIVKTATNPELAVCAVQPSKDDGTSKYSLESVLLDDLTKIDNGNSTNETESVNDTVKDDSTPAEQTADVISPQARLSLALERASQRITSDLDGSNADLNSKTRGNGARRRTGKQSSEITEKELQVKKHLSQTLGGTDGKARETVRGSDLIKGNNKNSEKKIVTVEVKRCRGKSFISRKTLNVKSSGSSRDINSAEKMTSEKFVSEKKTNGENALKNDQTTASRKSLRIPKKRRNSDDESMPSTSGIGLGKTVKEHSSQRSESMKRQKKQSEKNFENSTSSSKLSLKGKVEEKPPIVMGTVDTTEEKKKPKDSEKQSANVKTNIGEKVTHSASAQEGASDKRNVEDVLHSSSLTSKSSKKEEKKVIEIIGTPVDRNVVKDGSNNTTNLRSSRATRSMKRMITKKYLQSPKHDEHKKEKNKENVEKLIRMSVDAGDDKKQTEETAKSQTLVAKSDKNDKSREEKDHKFPLVQRRRGRKRKTEENVEVSTSTVKQKRVEREIQESLPDTQISPSAIKDTREKKQTENSVSDSEVSLSTLKCTSKPNSMDREIEEISPNLSCTSKQNRTEREIAESLQEVSVTTPKGNTVESDLSESLPGLQDSSTAVKRKRVVKENEESLPNLHIPLSTLDKQAEKSMQVEQSMLDRIGLYECPVTIDSLTKNLQRVPDVLSDNLFFEFEDITFEMLRNKAKQLVLPTPLWGAQISTEKDLVAFTRMRADLSDDEPMIDKALVFQGSLKPIALINNEPVDLPIPCVRSFEDVVVLIRNFHSVSFCDGTGIKQRPQSKYCFRYLDVANPGQRCSQCLEERRRLLFACVRKLKERLRVMRAARNRH